MRSLEDARESWRVLQRYSSVREVKDAVRIGSTPASIATAGIRSVLWKTFLLFDSLDVTDWLRTLAASRSAYNSLRTHFFRHLENSDELAGLDPLGQDAEMHEDEELRKEILQDVERIGMPDFEYFRQPQRQRMLVDILFVFCKLNPDVGYRQGMHEIAAPILFVVESDAVDVGGISKTLGEDGTIKAVFDAEHVEHDSFALFGQVMQNAKTFVSPCCLDCRGIIADPAQYLSDGPVSISTRSQYIFDDLLTQVDPDLVKHLKGMDIVPQVFLIRWIRLLFGREFDFDAVLTLWDLIYAEDASLELVNHICLAMLLRIRWHLLDADYNNALSLLLRYPELEKDFPAQTFGLDALYLRNHMTMEGGSYLVLKYTGRPLSSSAGRPATPPALQRNITTFAIRRASQSDRKSRLSPPRAPRQTNNIEAMLQNTAKNLYARGEKLGIGRAVRTAVDEVHKKAQEIREAQTSSPRSSRKSGNVRLLDHVQELEVRNKRLAGLLAGAVNELWEYQRLVTEEGVGDGQPQKPHLVETLSTAIAKVQFVQVYLDEPTMSLDDADTTQQRPSEEATPTRDATESTQGNELQDEHSSSQTWQRTSSAANELTDPSEFEDFSAPINPPTDMGPGTTKDSADASQQQARSEKQPVSSEKPSRPLLEQSAFSFMLESASDDSVGGTKVPLPSRHRSDDGIFGGHRRIGSAQGKSTFSTATGPVSEDQTDEFDIGSLRRAKGARK